jgi:hypothetical protein
MLDRHTTTTATADASPVAAASPTAPAAPPPAPPRVPEPLSAPGQPPAPQEPRSDAPAAATGPQRGAGLDDRTDGDRTDQAREPATAGTTPGTGTHGTDPADDPADEPIRLPEAVTRPVAQLPADLLRRIPIQHERYRRWQDQWAELQADDVDLDEVAARYGVGRRHLTWVRTAGQAGWLDDPDPPAYRLAALGAHPARAANTAPHNGRPYPGTPDDTSPAEPAPDPQPVLTGR